MTGRSALRDMKKFSGLPGEDIGAWSVNLKMCLEADDVTEDRSKVIQAGLCLDGEAAVMFRQWYSSSSVPETVDAMVEKLRSHFQRPGKPVASMIGSDLIGYFDRFDAHLKVVTYKSDTDMRQHFMAGLSAKYRQAAALMSSAVTLDDLKASLLAAAKFMEDEEPVVHDKSDEISTFRLSLGSKTSSNSRVTPSLPVSQGLTWTQTRALLLAEGRCFLCYEQGHMGNACPQREQLLKAMAARKQQNLSFVSQGNMQGQ